MWFSKLGIDICYRESASLSKGVCLEEARAITYVVQMRFKGDIYPTIANTPKRRILKSHDPSSLVTKYQ